MGCDRLRHGAIMLTSVKLRDQWEAIVDELPANWDAVRLRLHPEQPSERREAARILAPMGVGLTEDGLVLTVRRAGGQAGPEAARRLFGYLDDARVWCVLERAVTAVETEADSAEPAVDRDPSLAEAWDDALAELPRDWSDLLCELELDSSDFLDRMALNCAPLNPTRDGDRLAFRFRCARLAGYGVSPGMARRCFERCDREELTGRVAVLRLLSETDNVATQGAVWVVGGRML